MSKPPRIYLLIFIAWTFAIFFNSIYFMLIDFSIICPSFNRKVSMENIFFRNKPCKAFPLIQGSLSRGLGCLTDTPRLPEESGHSFRLRQRNEDHKFYFSRKLHRLLISFHAGQISYGVPNPFPLFPTELHSSHNRLPYLWPTRRGRTVNK